MSSSRHPGLGFLDRERALEQAKAADATRKEGKGIGPLHGLPVGVKDIIDTADMPTENGCTALQGASAARGRGLRHGAAPGRRRHRRQDRDDRARRLHSGRHAQSAQSRAHARRLLVGLGGGHRRRHGAGGPRHADGGSVIRPAAFCGVYGFKPTLGLIPRSGVLTQAHSLDTVGVMGRSVEDLALMADALQGYDERDPASLVSSRPRLLATATEDWPLAPLFVFVKTHAWTDADAATHEAFGELAEHLGGQIEEISLDRTTERGIAAARTVQRVELAFHFGPLLDRAPDLISQPLAGPDRGGPADAGRRLRRRRSMRAKPSTPPSRRCCTTTARS